MNALSRLLLCLIAAILLPVAQAASPRPPVKVAVIGGIVMCGVWDKLAPRLRAATGLEVELAAAAPKEGVVPVFRAGGADLLLIHGSDETYRLQAEGYAAPLRVWAGNQHVFVGPADDPAGLREAKDGVDAIARIKAADAPLLAFRDPGSFSILADLWRRAGLRPGPRQLLHDDGESPQQVLRAAARQQAYVIVGHIPVAFGKMPAAGLEILLSADPDMRRAYVVVEPGPRHPADRKRRAAAHRIAEYLLSPRGQADLSAADQEAHGPWVYPLRQLWPARPPAPQPPVPSPAP